MTLHSKKLDDVKTKTHLKGHLKMPLACNHTIIFVSIEKKGNKCALFD